MNTISLLTGQVSDILFVPAGARVTTTGSGSVEWTSGSLTDAKNAPDWNTWALGTTAGYMDALRALCIRATATGSMTVTIEEGVNDKYAEGAYWEEDIATLSTDSNGNTVLVGADGPIVKYFGGFAGADTRPTVMAIGSSLVSQNQANALAAGACPYYAHIQNTLAILGQPWRWVDTGATDGTYGSGVLKLGLFGWSTGTSAQIAPYFDTLIKPHTPDYCFMHLLDNDTTGTAEAVSIILARVETLMASAISAGITPILFSGAPSTGIDSLAEQTRYWQIHRGVEAIVAQYSQIIYVPLYEKYTDTSQTYGPQPLNSGLFATYTDGIHPRLGAYEIAKFTAECINERVKTPAFVIPTPGQAQLLNPNNLLGGSLAGGSGITGNVPAAYVYSSSALATATVTTSLVERYGKQVLKVVVSTSGAQTGTVDILNLSQTAIASGWSIGDMISLVVDIEFDPATAITGVKVPQLLCAFNGAVTTYPASGGQVAGYTAGGDTAAAILRPGLRMLLATQPVPVPDAGSDNVTAIRPYFYLKCVNNAASVAVTFYLHSFSLINHSV